MERAYWVPDNFMINARGVPVPTGPRHSTARWLLGAEAEWLESKLNLLSPTERARIGISGPALPGTHTATQHGLPVFANASPARLRAKQAWRRMISIEHLRQQVQTAPLYSSSGAGAGGGVSTMPVFELHYNLRLNGIPSTRVVGPQGTAPVGPAGFLLPHVTTFTTMRTVTPEIKNALEAFADAEERRRRYADTVTEMADATAHGDFYDADARDIPRIWPADLTLVHVPRGHGATTSGAWFPFYLSVFESLPQVQSFLNTTLGIYTSESNFVAWCKRRSSSYSGSTVPVANHTPQGLGCFFETLHYFLPTLFPDPTERTRAWEIIRNVCWNSSQTPLGMNLDSSGSLPFPTVSIAHARRLFQRINELLTSSQLHSIGVSCVYAYDAQTTVHGRAGRREKVFWGDLASPHQVSFACLAGHYFPLISTKHIGGLEDGVRRFGLDECIGAFAQPSAPVPFVASHLSYSSAGHVRRDVRPLDTFTFLDRVLRKGTLDVHFSRIQNVPHALFADTHPDGSMVRAQVPQNVAEPPLRFLTYGVPDVELTGMTKVMEPLSVPEGLPELREELGDNFFTFDTTRHIYSFAVDYEDCAGTHEAYMVAAAALQHPTYPTRALFFPSVPPTSPTAATASTRNIFTSFIFPLCSTLHSGQRVSLNLWCHNLLYDFPHLFRELMSVGAELDPNGFLPKDGRIISARFRYGKKVTITCRDSWRLFGPGMSVANMPAAFGFARDPETGVVRFRKEVFLHDWVSDGTLYHQYGLQEDVWIPLSILRAGANASAVHTTCLRAFDFDAFVDSIPTAYLRDNATVGEPEVQFWKYAAFYCRQDAVITARALWVFNAKTLALPTWRTVQAVNCLSASSLADKVLRSSGAYERVAMLNGLLGGFFNNFVVGGRCQVQWNHRRIRSKPDEELIDMDARSLYPSAMVRLATEFGGFLQGSPRPIDPNIIRTGRDVLNAPWDGFFIRFAPLSPFLPDPYHYSLGLYPFKPARDGIGGAGDSGDEQSLQWMNDLRGTLGSGRFPHGLFFDRVSFRDYLDHQPMYSPADFVVISGYSFQSGRNSAVADVIRDLYQQRLETSDAANKQLYKLLLNGAYGKTLQRPVPFRTVIAPDSTSFSELLHRHYDFVRSATPFMGTGSETFLLELARPFADAHSRPHIGAEVLSMSRRIMNEVTCLLLPPREVPEPADFIPRGSILYTDTDSIHLYRADWEEVVRPTFEARYGRPLEGSALGQFHSDFPTPSHWKGVRAERALFLDKKIYCYQLRDTGPSAEVRFHYSLKGISAAAVDLVCREQGPDVSVWVGVFEPLFAQKTVSFNLAASTSGHSARPRFGIDRRTTGFLLCNQRPIVRSLRIP